MKIILICGAPGSGKSTVAQKLAQQLEISQLIGSDTIREIARSYSTKENTPSLYTSAILYSNDNTLQKDSLIWGFKKQAEDLRSGMLAVIRRSEKENKDLILEGIHPIPGLLNNNFIQVVLTIPSEGQHHKQLLAQGDDRSSYKIDNFKKARAFQDYLIEQAKIAEGHIIENESIYDAVKKIIKIIR